MYIFQIPFLFLLTFIAQTFPVVPEIFLKALVDFVSN